MSAPEITRAEPPRVGDERTMLGSWLDYYRATLLQKCAGLSPEQLVARPCPPSTLSLIGLVRHMTEMERAYVHRLAEADLPVLADHMARSREIVAALGLDDTRAGSRGPYTVRFACLYLIKEYARHLGPADLLRERIDGVAGE